MRVTKTQIKRILNRKPKQAPLESVIEHQILLWLTTLKGYFWKNPTAGFFDPKRGAFRRHTSRFAIRGSSDILGVFKGRFVAIEVKSGRNKPTEEQLKFMESIRANGGVAFVAHTLDEAREEFDRAFSNQETPAWQ